VQGSGGVSSSSHGHLGHVKFVYPLIAHENDNIVVKKEYFQKYHEVKISFLLCCHEELGFLGSN
jgi:hypothetical protein